MGAHVASGTASSWYDYPTATKIDYDNSGSTAVLIVLDEAGNVLGLHKEWDRAWIDVPNPMGVGLGAGLDAARAYAVSRGMKQE